MEANKTKILLVEDERHLAAGLKLNFQLEGFAVDIATTAREAGQFLLQQQQYALVVLDVMLPDLDGFSLCRNIRDAGDYTPVIMLTARSNPEDRVAGLEAGADDYLVKPFDLGELLARIRSMLRRQRWEKAQEPVEAVETVAIGETLLQIQTHELIKNNERISLTKLEYDLLRYFLDHPGRVITRRELMEQVWKLANYPNTRTVDNFVARLRKLFEPDPTNPVYFVSVRGEGYRFSVTKHLQTLTKP